MSYKSSKHSAERSAYSQAQDAAAPTSSSSTRKRSNTKHSLHPPTIHLSLKKSSSTFFSSSSRSPVASSPDDDGSSRSSPRKAGAGTEAIPGSPSSVVHPSTPTPSPGRSTIHSLGYGAHRANAALAASPDRLSSLTVPTSLPLSLSALSIEPSLELVQPSPSSVSSMRRPSSSREQSSSPFMRGRIPSKAPSISNFHAPTRAVASSAPTSRKGSGGSTDRDAGMHLDIKRLLSKPGSSAASDSETSYYRRATSSHRMTATSGPTRRATDEPIMEHTPRIPEAKISPVSEAEGERAQKQRNVLRRKASARSNPATPTASTFQQQQQMPPSLPVESRSASSKPRESRAPKRSASTTAHVVSLSSVTRHRSPPRNLTPAGAVAHAYMKQEERREALAEMSGSNDLLRGGSPSLRDKSSDSRGTFFDDGDGEGSGTYYTVFGSAAGRVVAVGTAEDSSWDIDLDSRFGHERFSSKSSLQSPVSTQSLSGMRSLSRKVSGKLKKSHEGARHRLGDIHDGRPSTSTGRPLGPSMDEYVDVRTHITAGASASNGTPEKKDKDSRGLRSMRSFVGKDKEGDRSREEDSSSGGKLWKLMKRISTGALREKFTQEAAPPPVPALPDNFKHLASSRMTFDIRDPTADTSSETGLKQFMTSRASMSAVRPSTAPGKGSPRSERPGSRPSTGPRPSTTTRSSSPMSSDIASSKFFPKSQSTRSSISSYGEELPPMPGASGVGQNIMSPGELYKLSKDVESFPMRKSSRRSRSRTRSAGGEEMISPADEIRPSLPPPRRSMTVGGKPTADSGSDPPSPMIPAFDISEPLNDFSSATVASRASLPTSEFGVLADTTTPPRPKRSSRRKPPPFDLVSPTASTPISPPMPVTPRTPRTPNLPAINVDVPNSIDRNSMVGSMHSHSTAREGYSASPSSSSFRSPIRFRELEAPRVQLSEREKAAKWDDLLARSDEAGGTLHLGEAGLMSDNIRFSEYSEI